MQISVAQMTKDIVSGLVAVLLLFICITSNAGEQCFGEIQVFERKSEANCDSYSQLVLNGSDTGIHVCDAGPFVVNEIKQITIETPELSGEHPSCQSPSFLVSGCAFRVTFLFEEADSVRFNKWLEGKLPGIFIAVWDGREILHQQWAEDFDFGGIRVGYLMQSELDMEIFQRIRDAAETCE